MGTMENIVSNHIVTRTIYEARQRHLPSHPIGTTVAPLGIALQATAVAGESAEAAAG
jgi:hypothetical protein